MYKKLLTGYNLKIKHCPHLVTLKQLSVYLIYYSIFLFFSISIIFINVNYNLFEFKILFLLQW